MHRVPALAEVSAFLDLPTPFGDQLQTIGLPDMRELKAAKARSVVSMAGLFVSSPISKRHQFLLARFLVCRSRTWRANVPVFYFGRKA